MSTLRTLLIDDEDAALTRLRQLCAEHAWIDIVGEARSGREAIESIGALSPELVFLDVNLGSSTGFDVLKAVHAQRPPWVIFMTAFDGFAKDAFDVEAIDYLLKPCSSERFARSLQRLRARLDLHTVAPSIIELRRALSALLAPGSRAAAHPAQDGLFLEENGRFVFVASESITLIEAARNFVIVQSGGKSYCHRAGISQMEQLLDADRFLRIHKSVIVNLRQIESIEPDFNGTYTLRLRGGIERRSGQSYRARIQSLLKPAGH